MRGIILKAYLLLFFIFSIIIFNTSNNVYAQMQSEIETNMTFQISDWLDNEEEITDIGNIFTMNKISNISIIINDQFLDEDLYSYHLDVETPLENSEYKYNIYISNKNIPNIDFTLEIKVEDTKGEKNEYRKYIKRVNNFDLTQVVSNEEKNITSIKPDTTEQFIVEQSVDTGSNQNLNDNLSKETPNYFLEEANPLNQKQVQLAFLYEFTIKGSGYVGHNHSLNVRGSSQNGALYQFWIKGSKQGEWILLQDYSEKDVVNWIPQKATDYQYKVYIKDKDSQNDYDDYWYKSITIQPSAVLNNFTVEGSGYVGNNHLLNVRGSSGNGALYQFWIKESKQDEWILLEDYSEKNVANWIPQKATDYQYKVCIKDKYSQNDYDDYWYKSITIQSSTVLNNFTIEGSKYVGQDHLLKVIGSSKSGALYQFWIRDNNQSQWLMIQDYSGKSFASWIPQKPGEYRYGVHIKDKYSNLAQDDYWYKDITINQPPAELNNFAISGSGYAGDEHILNAKGSSANGALYQFWIKDSNHDEWEIIQDYSEGRTARWIPQKPGGYQYKVHIKDRNSEKIYDDYWYKNINIEPSTILNNLTISGTGYAKKENILTVEGSSRNGALYQFWIKDIDQNQWVMIQDYTDNNSTVWIPQKSGEYMYGIHIKDKYSQNAYDDYWYKNINIRASIEYILSYYDQTLMETLNIQMTINPQTDMYGGGWKTATWEDTAQKLNSNNFIDTNVILVSNSNDEMLGVGKITASPKLNVRDKPTTQGSTIIATVNEGKEYTITGQSNGWYKITTETGITGWVSGAYIEINYTNSSKLTTLEIKKALYVRSEPTTATNNNFALARVGEKYTIHGQTNGWYKIKVGDRFGWIEISDNRGLCISILSNPVTSVSNPLYTTANQISTEMYQFLVLSGSSGISVDDLGKELIGKGILQGKAQAFIDAGNRYNINEVYLLSHALLETGNGTSRLANGIWVTSVDGQPVTPRMVYNVYGIGAVDSNPIGGGTEYAYKAGWFSPEEAIIGGAKFIGQGYINEGQDTLYKMKWNPSNPGTHQYATDIGWATKQTKNISMVMDICERYGSAKLIFDIPVYK